MMWMMLIIAILICVYICYRIYRSVELDEIMEMRKQAGLDIKKET